MIEKGSLSPVSPADEWVEVELTAGSGACDTAISRKIAESIPIRPSLASLRGMEYEVANGQSIPNLESDAAFCGPRARPRSRR